MLYTPSSSSSSGGGSSSSGSAQHFLLSELLKHQVPTAAEWVFVSLLATAAVGGACVAAAAHVKGT
jgi:hypothetical protein